jgi:parallel beta-helix repeat protein
VNGGSANNIGNLVVRDNIGPGSDAELGDGIALFHSARNRIINNSVGHNGPFDGIAVLGVDSNDNTIMGNRVEKTVGLDGGNPFEGGEGTGIIINNFLEPENPRRGESIFNNRVVGNLVRGNENSGVSNNSNIGGRIVSNKIEDNGIIGDVCFEFDGRRRCSPFNGPSNGIGVQAGRRADQTTRVFVGNNQVSGNVGNGISVSSQDNQITGNVAVDNGVSSEGDLFNRFDLLDLNFRFDENRQLIRDCDRNVWRGNVFNSAFPECAANGTKVSTSRGATAPPTLQAQADPFVVSAGAGTDGQAETISSRRPPRL